MMLLEPLWGPLQHDFMLKALLVGIFVSIVCATLSCFIVMKGWALVGDAVSHAVLPGIVVAYIIGIPMAIGALVSALLCVLSAGAIGAHSRVKKDAVLGIAFTGFLALGLMLLVAVPSDIHFMHVLLGNLLGIEASALRQLLISGAIALILLALQYKDLKLYCFDAQHARIIGLNVAWLHLLLMVLLALTTVASLQAVGLILVVAMLVTPGCIGFLLSERFAVMMLIAVGAAMFSTYAGVLISFYINGTTAGCIVLVQAAIFILAFCCSPSKGVLVARLRSRRSVAALSH
ncbi:metal ABC transporter permease [Phytohalomonas tamaricis]|uniref:metal ABC transporter permease n=1 Tax=Phytohalomonas tamaricis TaxID=2081032 RepID=UPI0021D45AA8|nr:metal ABC transporter permease [Phytohalomonas tamaricis]